jgi:CubicO group peptidase (beta-lactamase class C family)
MRFILPLLLLGSTACGMQPASTPLPPLEMTFAWASFGPAGMQRSGAAGIADRSTGRRVTVEDPVRVASVSKLVVALGVMRLVEQGRIDLDADVSRWLGYPLRNPAFPETPITLRMLLSHTSSIKDEEDNYVIPLGRTVRAMTTDAKSFDAEHGPGNYFRYSNLNFPVIASALENATGQRFDRLMEREVLKPLGLDACFNWTTCSDAKVARTVVLYRPDGSVARDDLRGRQPDCPVFTNGPGCDLESYVLGTNGALFSPQGGLRASAADLAVIGQLLLNRGRHRGRQFLSSASVETMLRPVWTFNGDNGDTTDGFYCAYGLAAQSLPSLAKGCKDDLLGNGRSLVGHAGEAYGVRSGLWIDRKRNVGIAYFAATHSPEPPAGRSSYRAIEEWLAARLAD